VLTRRVLLRGCSLAPVANSLESVWRERLRAWGQRPSELLLEARASMVDAGADVAWRIGGVQQFEGRDEMVQRFAEKRLCR